MLSVYDWSDAAGAETRQGKKRESEKSKKKKELIFRNLTHIFSKILFPSSVYIMIDMCIYINPLYLLWVPCPMPWSQENFKRTLYRIWTLRR